MAWTSAGCSVLGVVMMLSAVVSPVMYLVAILGCSVTCLCGGLLLKGPMMGSPRDPPMYTHLFS